MNSAASATPFPRRVYYGWTMVWVAAAAMVGTLPGRTQGLGLITEPLIDEFRIGRVAYAQINLFATLAGALFAIGVGGVIDRRGSRIVLTALAALLGATVLAMSQITGLVMLLLAVTLTRGLGQTALSIASLALVGKWFHRRLTWAMGVYALAMSVGFMLTFPAVGALVLARGWRTAWAAIGTTLLCVLTPLAWALVRSSPEETGEEMDGSTLARTATAAPLTTAPPIPSATLGQALRSPAFWVCGLASSMYGLVASGIGLFNEAILAERGFEPGVFHTALATTAITGLAGNVIAGAWAERGPLRGVLVSSMLLLAAGLAALPRVESVPHVLLQAVAMGVAGGFVMVVFFSFWGRAYGDTHLGRIQAAAQAMTVLGSALGPLALAWSVDLTGSYAVAFHALAVLVLALALAAAAVPFPERARAGGPPD